MKSPRTSNARATLARAVPWLVSALVVLAIARKHPPAQIVAAVSDGHARAVFPVAIAFGVVQIVALAAWDAAVFGRVLGGPRFREVVRAKAGCAVLQTLGWLFNAGAYGTWIARSTGASAGAAAGLVLYTAVCDLAAGGLVATASVLASRGAIAPALLYGAPVVAALAIAALVIPRRRALGVEDGPSLVRVFRAVPRDRALLQVLARTVNVALVIVSIWAAARAFGLAIPFWAAATTMPIVLLVGALPINVFGFGPVQGAWLLFTPWASGASILAFQLVWNVAYLVASLLRGGVFVPSVLRTIAEGRERDAAVLEPVRAAET